MRVTVVYDRLPIEHDGSSRCLTWTSVDTGCTLCRFFVMLSTRSATDIPMAHEV